MSDPVVHSIKSLRFVANLRDADIDGQPRTVKRTVMTVYREAVFLFGSIGTLMPAILLGVVAVYLSLSVVGLIMMLIVKGLGSP